MLVLNDNTKQSNFSMKILKKEDIFQTLGGKILGGKRPSLSIDTTEQGSRRSF